MKKIYQFTLNLFFIFSFFFTVSAVGATVKDVRIAQENGLTRLIFDLSSPVSHRLFPLSNPDRVVLDLQDAELATKLQNKLASISSGVLRKLRAGKRDDGTRFVLDLNQKVKAKSSVLGANAKYGPRVMVELSYGKKVNLSVPVKTTKNIANVKRDIVIVVDAGHGGKDPGALGQYKVREKDIVLSIAKELARKLNRVDGFKAVLTRSSDIYLKLRERSKIAREANADLLVSIHADAFTNPKARGASVWALSLSGKTSEMGRWLAQQEQSAELVGGISLDDKDQLLAEVLLDMSMNSKIQFSLDIGSKVLTQMDKVAHMHKNTVQQAGFVVLKSPDIPSILVETGFVSNSTEAKNLGSAGYRKKLATAMSKGIVQAFTANPPEGSLLSWQQQNKGRVSSYVVSKGDTLSEIARKNRVSITALRKANTLKNDVIWIGQKLVIPAG
ncbi:MAG: N-acetylmuramoyl-L-alanine amidase [Marinomonas sp.]|jgi:N-acetylmuramoyl-L-alanine amidase|uniref:N-acetylmuramoyl-L-alanine amidase n=1 Tax=unclassified Marinomonas TaxID=196814 RepID=UPI0005FA03C9|nr:MULTISPECIES: N-acetylmuramoyl-L-alanine amidase [unclassified Marinomonas]KJZ09926.1 N-acetylmuramoyl-L-alanine amidase [Marinomonas sp. S3726]KZM39066.1 N-acetylmuramoyl-L-alanine amidase [Marinomonas sp. SBI22]KZM39850.1 N-acetylmuramoyl-L-alanine amidase [Marinomonas sp. SBI8L]